MYEETVMLDRATITPRPYQVEALEATLQAYAQGLAEDHARSVGADLLLDPGAAWRTPPASDKQRALLTRLGIAHDPAITKGEAADLLTAVMGDWRQRDTPAGVWSEIVETCPRLLELFDAPAPENPAP